LERLVPRKRAEELDVRAESDRAVRVEPARKCRERGRAVRPVRDELRDHGVVEHADLRARLEALLEPQRARDRSVVRRRDLRGARTGTVGERARRERQRELAGRGRRLEVRECAAVG
jgi:hypothetical protein